MSKIIKNAREENKPVVVGGDPRIPGSETSRSSGAAWGSLAVTGFIRFEIEKWRGKIALENEARERELEEQIEKAYREGYGKGLQDGVQRERDERMKSIDALMKEAKNKSKNAIRNLEVKVVELAVAIAEKLMRKSIKADPRVVEEIVSETMSHVIGSERVVLKVSADDFKVINEKYNRWLGMAGSASEFKIEIDKRLRAGDFIVETEGGVIDSVVDDRIDVLVEELLKVSE